MLHAPLITKSIDKSAAPPAATEGARAVHFRVNAPGQAALANARTHGNNA
jgi:hypothetical protein